MIETAGSDNSDYGYRKSSKTPGNQFSKDLNTGMGLTSYSERRIAATPSLANELNLEQVDELLSKVNMNRSFL